MAEVSSRDLHVDSLLTQLSVGYHNSMYIADDFAPLVNVTRQSNLIPQYDQSPWFRNQADIRAPGTPVRRAGFGVNNSTYYCHQYAFGFEIPDEYRDNTDQPYDLDRDGTMFVTDRLQMARERAAADKFFRTGVWGSDHTAPGDFTVWDDYTTSTPLIDITTWMDEVDTKIAKDPNTVVIGKEVWSQLKWHPTLMDTIKYTQTAIVGTDLFARLLGVDRVLVGRAIYTTSPEGTAEASVVYQRIWGKNCLVAYVEPRPALMTPSAAYTFVWQRVPNAIQYISKLREDSQHRDVIEGFSHFDQHILVPRAGEFASGVIT